MRNSTGQSEELRRLLRPNLIRSCVSLILSGLAADELLSESEKRKMFRVKCPGWTERRIAGESRRAKITFNLLDFSIQVQVFVMSV